MINEKFPNGHFRALTSKPKSSNTLDNFQLKLFSFFLIFTCH